jgi:type III pantothenate kinase
MLLAIDIGNSNIVLGCIEGKEILHEARIATDLVKTSDQYCVDVKNVLSLYDIDLKTIEGVIVSSVVPPVLNSFRTAIMKLTGKRPMVVGPGIRTGLNILMDNPAQVGSDLIVAAVAALQEYPAPLIIIDMGTATTISVVDKDKAYIGGCICPGVKISADALSSRTAQLPGISLDEPKKAIGRNTVDSMRSGIMMGSAAMLDGMIARMEEELGQKATVLATGGIARFVVPMCRREVVYDRNLLLKGLTILYYNNRKPD